MALNTDFQSLTNVIEDTSRRDLAVFENLWRTRDADAWAEHPEIYRLLCQRILKLGEPLLAYDVAAEGVRLFATDVHLRQLLALALARSGAPGAANAILAALYTEGCRDEETLGLLARTHKDLAGEAKSDEESRHHLGKAYDFYLQAYQTTGGYWSGINAATLALVLGKVEIATSLARQIAAFCKEKLNHERSHAERYWLVSTRGEAALLLRNWPEAEDSYGQAMELGRGDWGNLQSTRRNAYLLMERLGASSPRLEEILAFPSVVVFTGHMVDRPGRDRPRFPGRFEEAVKEEIRKRLRQLCAGFGYASAACGSDILFLEALLELKGEAHVFLPFEKESFIQASVDVVPGADWARRVEHILAQAVEVQVVSQHSRRGGSVVFEFTNLILHGLAKGRADQLGTKLVPLAVWDGHLGDGLGGTATTVERWRKLGLQVEIIEINKLIPHTGILGKSSRECDAAPKGEGTPQDDGVLPFKPEIRALLFADAEGFSRLADDEVPRFVEHFLGLVGNLLTRSASRPLVKNTWGDGLYFVFANVRDAGQFALDLRDDVRSAPWQDKGLPDLNLRIGLHAGPVYACTDPVTGHSNYIGSHVSRAARIEPITPSGQVYASQAFAALAAAEGVREFRCNYVGQISMAKKYGTFPTYVVRRCTKDVV
jgi:class 3 adenylate cyclase